MFDPSTFPEEAFERIVEHQRKRFSMKPRVAIAGFGKSGKSSLFNAIYGEKVASVSMRTDETQEANTRERFGIDFTDTPGIGTGRFSLEKVYEMGVFDRQQVIIHALNGASAITADDEKLHDLIGRSNATGITVVNKVDLLDDDEQRQYTDSMLTTLGLAPRDFLFVSAKRGTNVPELVQKIADVLPVAMQRAFIGQQQADLKLKETKIRLLVYSKAAVCAGIAAVPIPIADIFILTPIQIAMVTAIGYFHGVEMTKERSVEFLGVVGAGVGFREAARQLVKFIPGWGSAVSAGIAFAGTVALGEAANLWFKRKMQVDPDTLRSFYKETAAQAKEEYQTRAADVGGVRDKVAELKKRLDAGSITKDEFDSAISDIDEED